MRDETVFSVCGDVAVERSIKTGCSLGRYDPIASFTLNFTLRISHNSFTWVQHRSLHSAL